MKKETPPLCQCGCGKEVQKYKKTSSFHGQIKGNYARYVHGHSSRKITYVKKICEYCGKEFDVKPCYWKKYKCCSNFCRMKNLYLSHPNLMAENIQRLKDNPIHKQPHTEETKSKIRKAQQVWRKTKSYLDFVNRQKERGINNGGTFKKGHKVSKETIEKIREARMHQVLPTKRTSIEDKISNGLLYLNIPHKRNEPLEKICFPDIFIEPNIVVFCDGDYWHNLPGYKERDTRINNNLDNLGYKVIRLWEHEIKNNIDYCLNKITCNL